uniref:Uncharacterized protein n=1 Tax=Phytophthora palustris tombus-like virus 1 TaxID=2976301 RepID=A0A9E8YVT8_9TOMB|nr:hypothetical protein [Phytophthora palustris tombus-like virus 1]
MLAFSTPSLARVPHTLIVGVKSSLMFKEWPTTLAVGSGGAEAQAAPQTRGYVFRWESSPKFVNRALAARGKDGQPAVVGAYSAVRRVVQEAGVDAVVLRVHRSHWKKWFRTATIGMAFASDAAFQLLSKRSRLSGVDAGWQSNARAHHGLSCHSSQVTTAAAGRAAGEESENRAFKDEAAAVALAERVDAAAKMQADVLHPASIGVVAKPLDALAGIQAAPVCSGHGMVYSNELVDHLRTYSMHKRRDSALLYLLSARAKAWQVKNEVADCCFARYGPASIVMAYLASDAELQSLKMFDGERFERTQRAYGSTARSGPYTGYWDAFLRAGTRGISEQWRSADAVVPKA